MVTVEAADERQLSRVVGRYGRLDLLLLDELGYVQIDPRGAELLFHLNARILETGTEPYRLRTSKTTARRKRAS